MVYIVSSLLSVHHSTIVEALAQHIVVVIGANVNFSGREIVIELSGNRRGTLIVAQAPQNGDPGHLLNKVLVKLQHAPQDRRRPLGLILVLSDGGGKGRGDRSDFGKALCLGRIIQLANAAIQGLMA